MRDDGFDSPESSAMDGFPPKYCRVIASRVNGDDALRFVEYRFECSTLSVRR